ncbi:MAG: Holliday junction branch migration protein RuvA [Trueperaceae bacterium]
MIAFLDGIITDIRDNSVVMQAGSFGFEVFAPKATLMACTKGAAIRLHTELVVKEDDLALYGFHLPDMLTLFRYLTSVSGIGPKLGLALLSSMPTTLIATAIVNGDAGLLSSAPGVGKKMAERLVVELKNKLPDYLMVASGGARPQSVLSEAGNDAVQALMQLGYREANVKGAVAELALKHPDDNTETLIRKALAKLR